MKRNVFKRGFSWWVNQLRQKIVRQMPLCLRRELSGREVAERLYAELKKRLPGEGEEIRFTEDVLAIIADDSDYHRTRTGYMRYDSAFVVAVGGKRWAIAFGEAWGSYPADPYDCEIAAVSLPNHVKRSRDETVSDVIWQLDRSAYFRNSLVFALADGRLVHTATARGGLMMDNEVGRKMMELMKDKFRVFVKSDRVTNPDFVSAATLDFVVVRGSRYKPGLIKTLARAVAETLATVEKTGLDQLPAHIYG